MDYYGFRLHVPVAARRAQAAHALAKLQKKGHTMSPVAIEGRKIATTFWGESWCDNLERYSDYANRLPRGRTYVRNGSVVDLRVESGSVTAMCKHVAAVLYGIGARLDRQPELLFTLRKVDQQDLIATAGSDFLARGKRPAGTKVLASEDLSERVGIELAPPLPSTARPAASKPSTPPTVTASSRKRETTRPTKSTKATPARKSAAVRQRLTPKKRQAISDRKRRYWAARRADSKKWNAD
jgi:uncharacterized Zn finger protein